MQLLCNGVALDLYEDTNIQFTNTNPLFAFDKLASERTTEFKLPATKTNDRVFELGRLPVLKGNGMRRRYDAQLLMSGIVRKGYLYVSEWTGKEYNAIFVTGNYIRLQRINEAGTIRNLLLYDNAITWSNTNIKDANSSNIQPFDMVSHEVSDGGVISPSVSLKYLIDEVATLKGIPIDWTDAVGIDKIRIIAANSCELSETKIILSRTKTGELQSRTLTNNTFLGLVKNSESYISGLWNANIIYDGQYYVVEEPVRDQLDGATLNEWICPYNCAVTFADDLSDDFFLVSGNIAYETSYYGTYWKKTKFLGGYSFNEQTGLIIGTPLRGRTIEIPANTPFTIVRKSEFYLPDLTQAGRSRMGFDPELASDYNIEVTFSVKHKFVYGENAPLNAIMPDIDFVDLLKYAAALTGTVLYYTDTEGIKFDKVDIYGQYNNNPWDKKSVAVISEGKVERTFADYARNNIIRFEDDDSVFGEHIKLNYTIDNDNLEDSNELLEIKMSEGGSVLFQFEDERGIIQIRQLVLNRGDEPRYIVCATGDVANMLRITLPAVTGISLLCRVSTRVGIQARMTSLEYVNMTPKTLINLHSCNYVWTESNWQSGVVNLTLAKI